METPGQTQQRTARATDSSILTEQPSKGYAERTREQELCETNLFFFYFNKKYDACKSMQQTQTTQARHQTTTTINHRTSVTSANSSVKGCAKHYQGSTA